jgi:hypothetical protein
VRAVSSLVVLMPSLTYLRLRLLQNGESNLDHERPSVTNALATLVKLSQLQTFHLLCRHSFMQADFRLLQGLKELQALHITTSATSSGTDDDVVVLLRSLPRLHTLEYFGDMPNLSHDALRSIGHEGPMLTHIEMPCHLILPSISKNQPPLFPILEVLTLDPRGGSSVLHARLVVYLSFRTSRTLAQSLVFTINTIHGQDFSCRWAQKQGVPLVARLVADAVFENM